MGSRLEGSDPAPHPLLLQSFFTQSIYIKPKLPDTLEEVPHVSYFLFYLKGLCKKAAVSGWGALFKGTSEERLRWGGEEVGYSCIHKNMCPSQKTIWKSPKHFLAPLPHSLQSCTRCLLSGDFPPGCHNHLWRALKHDFLFLREAGSDVFMSLKGFLRAGEASRALKSPLAGIKTSRPVFLWNRKWGFKAQSKAFWGFGERTPDGKQWKWLPSQEGWQFARKGSNRNSRQHHGRKATGTS